MMEDPCGVLWFSVGRAKETTSTSLKSTREPSRVCSEMASSCSSLSRPSGVSRQYGVGCSKLRSTKRIIVSVPERASDKDNLGEVPYFVYL